MAQRIKLLSLNTESPKHTDRILALCQQEQPDVIHFQEVFEVEMPMWQEKLGMVGHFVPMADVTQTSIHMSKALGIWGIAQFSRLPITRHRKTYYSGTEQLIPEFYKDDNPNAMNRVLSWIEVAVEPELKSWSFATTHFTWSTEGRFTTEQVRDLKSLNQKLDGIPEVVLTGDFNSPRVPAEGDTTNAFNQLSSRYHDNIPAKYKTSIDGEYHKAGPLELMVDGLFTTPMYHCSNVRVVSGVSDHKAIVTEVERRLT